MELFDDKVKRGKKLDVVKVKKSGSGGSKKERAPNELVFKVATNIKGNNCGLSMDYITRNRPNDEEKEYIAPFNEMGEDLKKEELEELKKEWREEFSDPRKINSRNMTHFMLSVDIEDTKENREKLNAATRQFCSERFGDEGFRYIAAQHSDTDKPHVHILLNNNNLETGKKHRIDMAWHYETRLMAQRVLKEHGIEQKATFKKDRQFEQTKLKEQIHDHEKDYSDVKSWFDSKLKTAAKNDEHFKQLKRQIDVIDALKAGLSETSTVNNGVTLLEHGEAPYQFDAENKKSYYVALDNGSTIWGVGLKDAIEKSGVKIGDRVDIQKTGTENVKIKDKQGIVKEVKKVGWSVTESEDIEVSKKTVIKAKDDRFSTQQQIKATQLLNELKADLRTYDSYQTQTGANQALRDVVKAVDPEKSLIREAVNKALNKEQKRDERSLKKEQRNNYFLAKELVKGESIIKSSTSIDAKEKKALLSNIETQKKNLTQKGIDVKSIERDYQSQLSENRLFSTAMREMNKTIRGTERQIKKDGQLDKPAAEKRLTRLMNAIHSAQKSELTKSETERLNQGRAETLNALKQSGVNVERIEKQWTQVRTLKESVQAIKTDLTKPITKEQAEQHQSNILALQEQLKTRIAGMGKKDAITLNKSLERSQEALSRQHPNDYPELQKEAQLLIKGIERLDEKIHQGDKYKANQQAYAMTKRFIDIEEKYEKGNLLPEQKHTLSKTLNAFNQSLIDRGFDPQSIREKRQLTKSVTIDIENIKGLSMERARAKGLQKTTEQIETAKKSLKNTDMTRDCKREFTQSLNDKKKQINKVIAQDTESIVKLIKNAKDIAKEIEKLEKHKRDKSITPLDRLNLSRDIDKKSQMLDKVLTKARPLLKSVTDKEIRTTCQAELKQLGSKAKTQQFERGR